MVVLAVRKTTPANAETVTAEKSSFFSMGDSKELRSELATVKGELSLLRAQFDRADKILHFSTKYRITANMATDVFDASLREGIGEPKQHMTYLYDLMSRHKAKRNFMKLLTAGGA